MQAQESKVPLFVNEKGKRMNYNNLIDSLHRTAVKAQLGKWGYRKSPKKATYKVYRGYDVSPLRFRRTHATWALLNMKPAQAKRRLWGNESTGMDKIYSRITDKDAIEDYDRATGNKNNEKPKDIIKERTCFKCGKSYPITIAVCPEDGTPLNPEEIERREQGPGLFSYPGSITNYYLAIIKSFFIVI